jgi:hypothetical protein
VDNCLIQNLANDQPAWISATTSGNCSGLFGVAPVNFYYYFKVNTMIENKLAKAVAIALAATGFYVGTISHASASTTMYNTWGASSDTPGGETDGWLYAVGGNDCSIGGIICGATLPWVGTTNGDRPFGITGNSALNWAAHITQAGDTLQISREDAVTRYGVEADIDTAGGAWQDSTGLGWSHNTDIGLFKSDVTQDITLKLQAVNGPVANFGITVFTLSGTDLGTAYSHHNYWNKPAGIITPGQPILKPFTFSNPFNLIPNTWGGVPTNNVNYQPDALNRQMWDNSVGNTDATAFTFRATQGQLYAIYLGGSGGTGWNAQHDRYRLTISAAPTTTAESKKVPVPTVAVWLLGIAMAGLSLMGRRKNA